MSMTFTALVSTLHDERGRIDKILHLGAGCPDGQASESIKDFLEDLDKGSLEELLGQKMPPDLVEQYEEADDGYEEETRVLLNWIGRDERLQRFMVLADAQVENSWGHTYCIHGYGQSLEEAVQACILEIQRLRKLKAARAKKCGAK